MNQVHGVFDVPETRTSWVLDDVWPETASMVVSHFGPGDQLLAPGLSLERYRWPVATERRARIATMLRHFGMRRVARASGAIRQQTYLVQDRRIALRLARAIDWRARHLVVAQAWLPWLDEAGVLGGRSYDVVMSRYPFGEIHRLLDRAASEIGLSATIADYRADPALVAREQALLDRARRLITPHHGIAALFGGRASWLAWHLPPASARKGTRVAFLGPSIARERPDIARGIAESQSESLLVFGRVIEPHHWDGLRIEPRTFGPDWLDEIGTVIHPAVLTHQPRRLLEAVANGVTVRSTDTCGLAPDHYVPLGTPSARR